MAKIEKPKARKEYKCSKCGEVIKVGDVYLKGTPFRCSPIIRCTKCGLRSWELSSSNYVQGVGRVCDCWEEDYGCDEDTARGLSRVEAGNPGFPRLVQVTSGGFSWWL